MELFEKLSPLYASELRIAARREGDMRIPPYQPARGRKPLLRVSHHP